MPILTAHPGAASRAGRWHRPPHRFEGRTNSHRRFPASPPRMSVTTATYYDGSISARALHGRIDLDGEAEGPHARALNYVIVLVLMGIGSIKRQLTGETYQTSPTFNHQRRRSLDRPRQYGPGLLTVTSVGQRFAPVLDHPNYAPPLARTNSSSENKDGAIVLIFPLLDKVIVGTSDIPSKPRRRRCTRRRKSTISLR